MTGKRLGKYTMEKMNLRAGKGKSLLSGDS